MPACASVSSMNAPNGSAPTAPIMTVRAPIRAAATAWFAPLPPGWRANEVPISVSPGRGKRSAVTTRSTLIDPTTTTFPITGANPSVEAQDGIEHKIDQRAPVRLQRDLYRRRSGGGDPRYRAGPYAAQIAHRHAARVPAGKLHIDRNLDIAD